MEKLRLAHRAICVPESQGPGQAGLAGWALPQAPSASPASQWEVVGAQGISTTAAQR